MLPTWPRPLWEEPTVLSYHHRGKADGGNQAQLPSWPLGLVPPCLANLAKGLIWEGALSQAAGPCPPRAHTQVSSGELLAPEWRRARNVRAEDREGRKGGFQGSGVPCGPGLLAGQGGASERQCERQRERRMGGVEVSPKFEKPHCATWRRGVWRSGQQARKKEQALG